MFRKLVIGCLIGLLAACGAADKKKMMDLNESIDGYVAALRWARVEDARRFHLDRDHNKPDIDTSVMDGIRVTGYKIKRKTVNKELDETSVTAELDYYKTEYGTLKNITLQQEWWYDEESKKWYLESDFPTFE